MAKHGIKNLLKLTVKNTLSYQEVVKKMVLLFVLMIALELLKIVLLNGLINFIWTGI